MLKVNKHKLVLLVILDGWGIAPDSPGNAITKSNLPSLSAYKVSYPYTQLYASGEWVGLPKGEAGNSEVGHLNLGAGSIIYQELPRINMSIADGFFLKNSAFVEAANHVKKYNSNLHLMGLVGSGGVHSSIEHLFALINFAKSQNIQNLYLHLFTDGRDSPPNSAQGLINSIEEHTKALGVGKIASITGRYYAMDRDKRWDRTEKVYNALVLGVGTLANSAQEAISNSYDKKITDEFIEPTLINPTKLISDNDAVIFFNFRIDRPRQLTECFVLPQFETGEIKSPSFDPHAKLHHIVETSFKSQTFIRKKILKNLCFVTMTEYEKNLPVTVAFPKTILNNPIASVISNHGLRQLHITETEKEKFVGYYFNGLREDVFTGEDRITIPSPKVATYDKEPQMSSEGITEVLLNKINNNTYNFIVVNFPNADMVGHTGFIDKTIIGCEAIDLCLGRIIKDVLNYDGAVIISADHGNAEEMLNLENHEIDTEHSKNPVPCYVIANELRSHNNKLPSGILADVAPTILGLLDIQKPDDMTGRNLLA